MSGRNEDARTIVEEAEARLAPLSLARNLAWWESQTSATEANAERRTRAQIAWSEALSDREVFQAVERAREAGSNGDVRRRLDLLQHLMLRHQVPDALRERIRLQSGPYCRDLQRATRHRVRIRT